MRLLNTRTRDLEEFIGTPPPYAILSHTWGDEEVCFSNLRDSNINYTTKEGWYKIDKSCEQALQDGLGHLWVDSVCIDKSSSAELSEAINPMFKWYRNSAICYAYLCDLPAVSLGDSRWFSRGWTLQEMIAPKDLKFYDRNWKFISTKTDLIDQLYQITGVDTIILRGGNLRYMSVARRMSWAAKRQTTRVEDSAYCLLGLFDISMPMLYGEGNKAFSRLQQEILMEYDDQSLFAWRSSTTGNYVGLFAKSPADFIGSANIVPCEGRRGEPTVVTSHGLQITTAITEKGGLGLEDAAVLATLNCRVLDFDMDAEKRIALAVRKISGIVLSDSTAAFLRLRPNDLFLVEKSEAEKARLYILKDNNIGDLMSVYDFWVRTMPIWLQGRPFELALAHPRERWDGNNRIFRSNKLDSQYVLVFRQAYSDGEPTGHFLVFFGMYTTSLKSPFKIKFWCNIQFHRCWDLEALDLDHLIDNTDMHHSHSTRGAGVILKCDISMAEFSSRGSLCIDLHTKEILKS